MESRASIPASGDQIGRRKVSLGRRSSLEKRVAAGRTPSPSPATFSECRQMELFSRSETSRFAVILESTNHLQCAGFKGRLSHAFTRSLTVVRNEFSLEQKLSERSLMFDPFSSAVSIR